MEHAKTSCFVNININDFVVLVKISSSELTCQFKNPRKHLQFYIKKEKPFLNIHDYSLPIYVTS